MSDEMGPWNLIGWWVIGGAIGRAIRRHWRLILAALVAFILWRHFILGVG